MSIFDRFFIPKAPEGFAEVNVEFTQEESEAISETLERFATIAEANTPKGRKAVMSLKLKNGLMALGLTEYVHDLMDQLEGCGSSAEVASRTDKSIKAMMKAYAIHSLPLYLYKIAVIFQIAGDKVNAKEFYQQFLMRQSAFQPDDVDARFLGQHGIDIPQIVAIATEKVTKPLESMGSAPTYENCPPCYPVGDLAGALMCMAAKCTDEMFDGRVFASETKKQELRYKCFCEFLQCFIHIADKWIFFDAGAKKREEVMRLVVNSLADTLVKVHFPHAPKQIREGLRREFLHNLDIATGQFLPCTDLLIEDKPLAPEGVLNQLAFNVAEAVEEPKNLATLTLVVASSVNAMTEVDLAGLVRRVCAAGDL